VAKKIIEIEEREGPFQEMFQRVMKVVPQQDREDKHLQRLIAFRMKIDGEDATVHYLKNKIQEARQNAHKGSLYDFLKDTLDVPTDDNSNPPIVA
jgi:hypothetical protein